MNEDLLKLAYSKFETDADYETFKADILENEDLQRLAYSKFETDADFETFRGDLVGEVVEKKNQNQNEPSGESLENTGSLDSSVPQAEAVEVGSSDTQDTETPDPSILEDMWSSLKAGTKEALAGLSGSANWLNKGVFSLVAPKELEDYVNTLEPSQREVFINSFIGTGASTTAAGSMGTLGQEGAEKQEELNKEAEKFRSKMTQYETSITEDLGNLDLKQAAKRLAVEGVGTIPSIVQAMIPYVGLASVGAGTAANKQERLEAEGEDFGGMTVLNSGGTGLTEMLLEKYTAGQGKRLIGSILGKGEKLASEVVGSFVEGLKEVGKGALKEGGTEALQAAAENLIDAVTTGNEKEAFDIFTEIVDSFLVGAVVGAPMKGGEVVANSIKGSGVENNQTSVPEAGTVELNIPAVESIEELQTQLDYVTNKEGIEPDVRANLMRELGDKISALENGSQPEVSVEENVPSEPTDEAVVKGNKDSDDYEKRALDKINNGRNTGKSDVEIIEEIEDVDEKRTAQVLLQREADQSMSIEEAAEKSKQAAEKSRAEQSAINNQNLTELEKAKNKAVDLYVDRQGSVKNILKKTGLSKTIDFMVAKLGASSYAKHMSDTAHKQTFDGLKNEDIKNLEEIILLKNIISTDAERKKLGASAVLHQGGQTSVSAQKALLGYKKLLGDKKFNDLEKRATSYFDINKELLASMKKEGLISEELYDKIKTRDYQSRLFLDFMKDMDNNFLSEELDNFETSSLSADQIKKMKGGWEGSQSMDSQTLQQKSILAKTKAIFANRANSTLAKELVPALAKLTKLEAKENLTEKEKNQLRYLRELNSNVKMDRIIGFSESGKPKYAMANANTNGYKPIYYYKNGVANRLWLKESFYEKFTDTNNQILNASTREGISKVSGTRLVKTLATGENPLFFITNVPRDLAFALAFSKEYGSGFKTVVPVEAARLIVDFTKGIGQSVGKGEMYQKYIEYGGGMDFLTIQGRYGKDGIFNKYLEAKVDEKLIDIKQTKGVRGIQWLRDGIKRFNTASEFATRLAVFNRSIHNQLKKIGVEDINSLTKEKQDEVYTHAVRAARELTDFNQGGKHTKALDSGIPYLNAATQGTRAAVENFKERPVESTFRILQITAGFTTVLMTFAFNLIGVNKDDSDEEIAEMTPMDIYFKTLEGVSKYDLRNYYIIPTGKKDSNGNWVYYRVAKAQALTPFINTSEHFLRKFYAESQSIDYKQDLGVELKETVYENILPIGLNFKSSIGRVPLADAYVAHLGIDAYTGNPLDWKRGAIPEQLEGINDEDVENFYKELGEVFDYSPVRMKAVTESFITTPSTNPYIGFMYLGADAISGGEKKDMLAELKQNSLKRITKSTSEYNKMSKILERVNDDVVDAYRKHMTMEYEVRKAVSMVKSGDDEDVLLNIFDKAYKDSPEMVLQAKKWAQSELKKKPHSSFVNSLKYTTNKEVRAIILAEKFGDGLLKSEDHYREEEKALVMELLKEKVIDAETYSYYKKLVDNKK